MNDAPSFATDPATAAYYDRRAGEYDEWYLGEGLFADRERPGWDESLATLVDLVATLPPSRSIDVACGTAFLTRHLAGPVVGVDRSVSMVEIARRRLAGGHVAVGDALALGIVGGSIDRVFAGHFYGHLPLPERRRFLDEARRVGHELVVVDSARRPGVPAEGWQERSLRDGSRHRVYKRYLGATELASEIGGEVLMDDPWFVVAAVRWRRRPPQSPTGTV